MIKFKTDLFAQFLDSGLYKLTREFKIEFKHKKNWYLLKVPVGRKTDLASVPKIFWSIFSKDDRDYLESAIPHDEFYKLGGVVKVLNLTTGKTEVLKVSRLFADQLFKEGARVLGSSWFKRNTIFVAVRLGGKKSWKVKALKPNKMITKFKTSRKNFDPRIRG